MILDRPKRHVHHTSKRDGIASAGKTYSGKRPWTTLRPPAGKKVKAWTVHRVPETKKEFWR